MMMTVLSVAAACGKQTANVLVAEAGATHATFEPATVPVAEDVATTAGCDESDLWFHGMDDANGMVPAARSALFVGKVKAWSPECRRRALALLCEDGCDAIISGPLIDAASSLEEQRIARQLRLKQNTATLAASSDALGKVRKEIDYALSIVPSPRMSSYTHSGASLEEKAQQLAAGDPCMTRMHLDFTRIESLRSDIRATAGCIPTLRMQLDDVLVDAKSCENCSDDRRRCAALRPALKTAAEEMVEYQTLNRADVAALQKLAR